MNTGPILSSGSTGTQVQRLQRILVMIKNLDSTKIDGIFGPTTSQAVKSFQSGNGLVVDGVVGPKTWEALPADPDTPTLTRGATDPAVTGLQQGLKKYSATPGAPTDPGAIDGYFGPKVEAAVRAYQADRGLVVDGVVGDKTWWAAGAAGATLASLSGLATA